MTVLVTCWLIHCNLSILPCVFPASSCPKCNYKSLSFSTPWFIKENHSRSQLMYLHHLKWFLLFLILSITFCSGKRTLLSQQTFSTLCGKFPRVCSSLQGRWGVLWQPQLKLKCKFLMSPIWKWSSDWNSSSSVFIFSVNLEFTPVLYLQFTVYVADVSTDSTGWVQETLSAHVSCRKLSKHVLASEI